jgi:hypothetical protein
MGNTRTARWPLLAALVSTTLLPVAAGAQDDVLFVTGDKVGIGTATPATELHVATGDAPEIRLEQDGSGGQTPQTWDLAGDETGFFVRDVTNGGQVPLRVASNAPTSSVEVTAAGDVGMGTAAPAAPFHLQRTTATGLLMQLERNGDLFFRQKNSVTGQFADMNLIGNEFRINFGMGGPGPELRLTNMGDLIILGTYTPDYVFDPDYALMPLTELADFVARERHLPNVPNAAEIREHGLNVNAFPMQLLEKIEELTLYTLQQERTISRQERLLADLEARLAALESEGSERPAAAR